MINQASMDLIKSFEGFEAAAYQDSAGIWTIGYGTTARAGVGIDPKPGMVITQAQAEHYLHLALDKFSAKITKGMTRDANPNQFGAMVSLAYNIGPDAFLKSSALRHFNAGDMQAAARAITLWNKATVNGKKVVLKGLVRRREAEAKLFLTPVGIGAVWPPIPNRVTPPDFTPKPPVAAQGWFAAFIAAIVAMFRGK